MKGVVIITGANSGIGKAAAYQFATNGYQVIMACRDIKKSQPIYNEIKIKTKNSKVELFQLDISSKKSISVFCEAFKQKYNVLDILIHNAGHFNHGEKKFQPSVDGMELTSATNLLGPVLMTSMLTDVLSNSPNPRVLNACSTNIKHFFDERRKIDFEAMRGQVTKGKSYDSYKLYGDSKMGLLMATEMMAKELRPYNIKVNAIMIPATRISKETMKNFKPFWKLLAILQRPFVQKIEVIAKAYYKICTSDTYAKITGKLLNHQGELVKVETSPIPYTKIITSQKLSPPYTKDKEAIKKVWTICNQYRDSTE